MQKADLGRAFKIILDGIPDRELSDAGSRDKRRAEARRLRGSLAHFFAWCGEHFGLLARLEKIPDPRDPARARIPQSAVLLAVLLMYWLRIPSVRSLDQGLRPNSGIRRALALAGWRAASRTTPLPMCLPRLTSILCGRCCTSSGSGN